MLLRHKVHLISLIFFISIWGSDAQILPNRYLEQIFSSVVETKNIQYSTGVPQPKPGGGFYEWVTGYPLNAQEDNFDLVNLSMDIFQPQGDTMELRPLIIIAFGGGFLDNDRNDLFIRLLAQNLALRGFVTASIDYRLGMNIFDEELSKRAVYRGLQDGRSAVRFFKNDYASNNTYRIDTNLIFMGGHSSGSFIALHTAFMDKESERPLSTFDFPMMMPDYPDLGCLDCVGDNQGFKGNVKGVFNLAGAVGDTLYLENVQDPPVISFHSKDDATVPFYGGQPFSDYAPLVFGFDLPEVKGMDSIHARAINLNMVQDSFAYESRGHDVHHNGISLYPEIVPNISTFFYQHSLKPGDLTINGNQIFCVSQTIQAYQAVGGTPKYYEWNITGGTIINPDVYSSSIEINWDPMAPAHEIKVTPYSSNGARGNQTTFPVNITNGETVTWTGSDGMWKNVSNWNLSRIPLQCDDVSISTVNQLDISIIPGSTVEIKSLTLKGPVDLLIPETSIFRINNQ